MTTNKAKPAPQGVAEVMALVDAACFNSLCPNLSHIESRTAVKQSITAIITERDTLRAGVVTLRAKVEELPDYRGVSWAVNRNDVLALIDKMGGKV